MLKRLLRERARTRAVRDLMPGGAVEPRLERYAEQAASAFAAPIALVSLIHDDEQRVVAAHGLTLACLPRDEGFCTHALDHSGIMEVCDPLGDRRFRHLPSVAGPPHARYYIGSPLTLFDRTSVGMLCVLDVQARAPASPDQRAYLAALARQASMLLEQRMAASGMMPA